ncbi:MAG TPA: ribosomal protein S18-alanine N-acetyltransferase [Gemmatimonadaceae bacterium]|nr:ribosomal protein S18-alanine N-acetyltransferase [Gemmatimonadaceae bacterium]
MRPTVRLPPLPCRETGDGIRIRFATASDVDRVVQLETEAFSDAWTRSSFEQLLSDTRSLFAVACGDDGLVHGYVVAWYVADEGEIANLAVASTSRRRGIGGMLLDTALDTARTRKVASVYLEVRDSNDTARSLYASRGFEEVTRRRRYYRAPTEDALVLKLDLRQPRPDAPR